jgi:hypothetical protein
MVESIESVLAGDREGDRLLGRWLVHFDACGLLVDVQ